MLKITLYISKIGSRDPFILMPVSRGFIRKQLLGLNPRKAVGLDEIPSFFLRDGADSIVEPVCHIVNTSIFTEMVPSGFKQARVRPLFKKGSKLDAGNYRPVSVLSVLSKILERAVHDQLSHYLQKRGLLYEYQSGFRGSFSTDTCLIGLSDFIKAELGRGKLVGLVLMDLQKAFDTVDHCVLMHKLEAMGVSCTSWFYSYLSGRKQCVEVDGLRSDLRDISCGVPQGSILGPLLFLVYINDMYRSVQCQLSLYADDSALMFSHSDANVIAERLGRELSSCRKWLIDNRLSLHVGKTECIVFGTKRRLKSISGFSVSCDGMTVRQVSSVKYLGVSLNQCLDFTDHVTGLLNTCANRLKFLYRNAAFLDFECRRILCNSLLQPYIDYCCSSWYSSISQLLRNRLDTLQRRMIRFVLSKDPLYHVLPEDFERLSWLSIPNRVSLFKLNHVFKIRMGKAPRYLCSNFQQISDSHMYNTRRSSFDFHISKELSCSTRTFAFTAVKLWNGLPQFLKELSTYQTFKSRLKEYLMSLN